MIEHGAMLELFDWLAGMDGELVRPDVVRGPSWLVTVDDGTVTVHAVTPDRARLIRWEARFMGDAPLPLIKAAVRATR